MWWVGALGNVLFSVHCRTHLLTTFPKYQIIYAKGNLSLLYTRPYADLCCSWFLPPKCQGNASISHRNRPLRPSSNANGQPTAIANTLPRRPCVNTIRKIDRNLKAYGQLYPPSQSRSSPRHKITRAAKEGMLFYLDTFPWTYQCELVIFLDEEWDIQVHRSTVSRLLKEWRLSRKQGQRIGPQNDFLRGAWQADKKTCFTADMLVFIDESLFKE